MTRRAPLVVRTAHWIAAILVLATVPAAGQSAPRTAGMTQEAGGTLRPGDLVRLRIWREPDLSGDFSINEAGVVVFPKVGPLTVVGMPPDSLKATLLRWYGAYLVNPSIEVIPLRRIQVLGAVRNPGLYPVDPTMTVGDVLAVAGGPTPEGKTDRVHVIRDGTRLTTKLSHRTRIADSAIRSGDQLYVPERSWVKRYGVIGAGLSVATTVLIAVLLR